MNKQIIGNIKLWPQINNVCKKNTFCGHNFRYLAQKVHKLARCGHTLDLYAPTLAFCVLKLVCAK